jgi:hypothetical protein
MTIIVKFKSKNTNTNINITIRHGITPLSKIPKSGIYDNVPPLYGSQMWYIANRTYNFRCILIRGGPEIGETVLTRTERVNTWAE